MPNLGIVIKSGLRFIASQQRSDGGFDGLASVDPTNFSNTIKHPTIFFSALISQSCSSITGSEKIIKQTNAYLLRHKSAAWSWNYWQRDMQGGRMRGYPDDLDDTACALAALALTDKTILTGEVLGYIGQQLVAAEHAVGGPYQTWLVPSTMLNVWHDVDVAVNANIAYLLSLLGIMPPGLETYLTQALEHNQLVSSYYLDTIPTLYFIARANLPQHITLLTQHIEVLLQQNPSSRTPLMNALLLAAACKVGYKMPELSDLALELLNSRQQTHWEAYGLYVEPPLNGKAYFAGSSALTTAFACEALSLYKTGRHRSIDAPQQSAVTRLTSSEALQATKQFATTITQPDLQHCYQRTLQHIEDQDTDQQISAMAAHFNTDSNLSIKTEIVNHLDQASINGWIAYSLYDNILDGEAQPVELSTANIALRQCLNQFQRALPQHDAFQAMVQQVLDIVDGANAWEAAHAQAVKKQQVICIDSLPDYGDYAQLAQRSWGHALAASGVLLAGGHHLTSPQMHAWQRFFHHFLIARQLNDDAHDWLSDLQTGRLTAVVCMLLKERSLPITIDLSSNDLRSLQEQFWLMTVEEVCQLATKHVGSAERALKRCDFLRNATRYSSWLQKLEGAITTTLDSRKEAMSFMRSFSNTLLDQAEDRT